MVRLLPFGAYPSGAYMENRGLHNFPDQAEGRRRFPTFDTNKDGALSEEEFVSMGGKLKKGLSRRTEPL